MRRRSQAVIALSTLSLAAFAAAPAMASGGAAPSSGDVAPRTANAVSVADGSKSGEAPKVTKEALDKAPGNFDGTGDLSEDEIMIAGADQDGEFKAVYKKDPKSGGYVLKNGNSDRFPQRVTVDELTSPEKFDKLMQGK